MTQGQFETLFQPYFGGISPLLVFASAIVLGAISLFFLRSRGFEIYKKRKCRRGVVRAAILATIIAIPVVLVDVTTGYPENINVPLPQALLFYPLIACVAEIIFHAIPLSLLFVMLGPWLKERNANRLVWLCIILVSFLEPIYQLNLADKPLSRAGGYTGVHVFAINLLQLYIFRRYDFVSMLSFRLVYYLHWHILWGCLRLQLLF